MLFLTLSLAFIGLGTGTSRRLSPVGASIFYLYVRPSLCFFFICFDFFSIVIINIFVIFNYLLNRGFLGTLYIFLFIYGGVILGGHPLPIPISGFGCWSFQWGECSPKTNQMVYTCIEFFLTILESPKSKIQGASGHTQDDVRVYL